MNEGLSFRSVTDMTTVVVSVKEPESVTVRVSVYVGALSKLRLPLTSITPVLRALNEEDPV